MPEPSWHLGSAISVGSASSSVGASRRDLDHSRARRFTTSRLVDALMVDVMSANARRLSVGDRTRRARPNSGLQLTSPRGDRVALPFGRRDYRESGVRARCACADYRCGARGLAAEPNPLGRSANHRRRALD
jgi:hypothetical protein